MKAEEQEEPILRLSMLSGVRTGQNGKLLLASLGTQAVHESPQRQFPLDSHLDHKMLKGR